MAFDRLRARGATLGSGCDAQPTTSIIDIARVMEEVVGGADTAGQVWGDVREGACDRGVHVSEGRARMRRWRRTDERKEANKKVAVINSQYDHSFICILSILSNM
jgi:hypothetical protein